MLVIARYLNATCKVAPFSTRPATMPYQISYFVSRGTLSHQQEAGSENGAAGEMKHFER
jgi:hypothetical protein